MQTSLALPQPLYFPIPSGSITSPSVIQLRHICLPHLSTAKLCPLCSQLYHQSLSFRKGRLTIGQTSASTAPQQADVVRRKPPLTIDVAHTQIPLYGDSQEHRAASVRGTHPTNSNQFDAVVQRRTMQCVFSAGKREYIGRRKRAMYRERAHIRASKLTRNEAIGTLQFPGSPQTCPIHPCCPAHTNPRSEQLWESYTPAIAH